VRGRRRGGGGRCVPGRGTVRRRVPSSIQPMS
jgi:hypothetical protein